MRLSLYSLCLAVLSTGSLVIADSNLVDMKPTFKQELGYKNIAFGGTTGGSSHITWALSIGEELGARGHNFTFVTVTQQLGFAQPYSHIKTIDIGPLPELNPKPLFREMSDYNNNMADILARFTKMLYTTYERDFTAFVQHFKNSKTDVALCDHLTDSCIDAAKFVNIPYIVTAAVDMSPDSAAPFVNNGVDTMEDFTTEYQGFKKRFINKFVKPWIALYYLFPCFQEINGRKQALGMKPKFEAPAEGWKDSVKLVNNLFGFTATRPIGTFSEYVGPIIPKQYKPLTSDLEAYLNSHKRVAYVAFGQTAAPTKKDIDLVLTTLVETLEAGHIDGFLWATRSKELFSDTITSSSGTTYKVGDMFNHRNPHARVIDWAPQTAVLMHPSTVVFLSHGGLGSWYESMYAGTPMAMLPFFADQPGNSLMIERSGLGGLIRRDQPISEIVDILRTIVVDESGEIKNNVKRTQAMVQIHSEHGILRGADIVEEVAYTHKDGKLPHREPANRRMSYLKANNYDLYIALFTLITGFVGSVSAGIYYLAVSPNKNKSKLKKA